MVKHGRGSSWFGFPMFPTGPGKLKAAESGMICSVYQFSGGKWEGSCLTKLYFLKMIKNTEQQIYQNKTEKKSNQTI